MTFTVSVSAAPVDDSDADGSPTSPDLISATAPGLVMLEAILRAGTVTEAAPLVRRQSTNTDAGHVTLGSHGRTALFDRSRRTIAGRGPAANWRPWQPSTSTAFPVCSLCTGRSPKDSLAIGSLHSL